MVGDSSVLWQEIDGSRKRIGQVLGVEPSIFSFPNGLHDERALGMVRTSGYRYALLCGEATALHADVNGKGFSVLPRIGMRNADWKEENLRFLGLRRKLSS